ncbi:MAG TPA: ScyD/ScyE family protein, partial [Nocardioidaceae bacterium]|nr:ScyD/ScyE family protein [Nocardioidaceae bacterium]
AGGSSPMAVETTEEGTSHMRSPTLTRRHAAATLAAGVAVSLLAAAPAAVGSQAAGDASSAPVARTVAKVSGPRGLDIGPGGTLLVSRANGSFGFVPRSGEHRGEFTRLGRVPAGFLAPALDMNRRGQIFVLTTAGEPGARGAATLYRWTSEEGRTKLADIAAYQQTDVDPYDLEDNPTESNPYGVAALGNGGALVADAAGNDLLRVSPDGAITTVATVMPRTVRVPRGLGEDAPPAGTRIPSEAVITSVTVGRDGSYYIGELRGFPATPRTSQLWRVAPSAEGAICNPRRPNSGLCTRVVDDLTSVVGLQSGPKGQIVVAELARKGWLKAESGDPADAIGAVRVISRDREVRRELARGEIMMPGDVAVDRRGRIFVTAPIFGPGKILRVR